jgi:PAS domain S-box-containing protein
MEIYEEKQNLLEQIAKYEVEIELLKKENSKQSQKIEQFEKNQKSFDKLMNESTVPIIIGNKKGQIIGANHTAIKLTKYSLEEILQKSINEILVNQNVSEELPKKIFKKPANEISNEQILVKKTGKKIFVLTHTMLLPNNTYQIVIKKTHKRKKAELALVELQNRYKQLAENIKDVIWTATKELKIVYISGAITKITGFNPEIYYQKPLYELLTPISYQLLLDTMEKESELLKIDPTSKNKYPITLEIKLLQKEHSNVWVELSIALIKNQLDETVGYQGIIRNIDEHKKIQENLNRSNQRYNFAIKSAGSGVWELNADLTSISIDNNLINMLGYDNKKPKSLLNDWIHLTYKEDRTNIIDILQDILDGKKQSYTYDCRRIHKNGSVYWFNDYVEGIYDENGNIIELIGTSKNITNEKLTEEKKYRYYAGLQILIESTFQFLKFKKIEQIYDYTGHILNQKIPNSIIIFSSLQTKNNLMIPTRFYGFEEQNLLKDSDSKLLDNSQNSCTLSKKAINMLNQKFLIEFKHGIEEFMEHKTPGKICETICSTLKNYRFYVIGIGTNGELSEAISIIIKDGLEITNKEFIEAFITLSSIIIDKKKIELELKKSNETKDKFFSILSHDLKNPFNTFIGFSNLIINNIESISKEKVLDFAHLINDAAKSSHEMMNNLFEWVRSQKGTLKCNPVKIDIKELISTNIKLFNSDAKKKEIDLKLKSGPEINFYADNDMMNTVFRNLLSNAIKFTKNEGKIIISYKKQEKSVLFSIKDNGIGISDENQKNLFHIITNKSTDGTNNEKGTGLGLLLCKEFIMLHGGDIWVESEPDKGSEFLFTIPILA